MSAPRGCFITGTDTGVGKTKVGLGLVAALQARGHTVIGMKPVASGCLRTHEGLRNEDAVALRDASSMTLAYEAVNPYAFEPPVAPHIAAREAGVEIVFERIRGVADEVASRADFLLVEGVGGWRVPLGADGDVAGLAAILALPVVLVIGVRLGCLNHAFLTAEAVIGDGLRLAGWVANLMDPYAERRQENVEALRVGIAAPCLGVVPFLSQCRPARIAACLNPWPLL